MICSKCGLDKLCLHFREYGNNGTKSYVNIIPVCGDCMKIMNFPFDEKELDWK